MMLHHFSRLGAFKIVCTLPSSQQGRQCVSKFNNIFQHLPWRSFSARSDLHSTLISDMEERETTEGGNQQDVPRLSNAKNLNVKKTTMIPTRPAAEVLAELSSEQKKLLKVLKLEYDVMFSLGHHVPENVTDDDWLQLLQNCRTPSSRRKYFSFLRKKERAVLNDKRKKEAKRIAREEEAAREEQSAAKQPPGDEEPRRFRNSIHFIIRESTMNHHYYNNLAHAMVFGPHLVFDLSFESQLHRVGLVQMCKQLCLSYAFNKKQSEPFAFTLTGLTPNGETLQTLSKLLPNMDEIPMTVTDQHYLDLFPAKDLVYLTPNADRVLTHYNANDVYIVGGIVDKGAEEPVTLAKAKRENIRFAKFPLEKYLHWGLGGKSLTLDQVTKIMSTWKDKGDWDQALAHVPKRKLVQY